MHVRPAARAHGFCLLPAAVYAVPLLTHYIAPIATNNTILCYQYKGNDSEVPVTQIKAETYPLMNLASEDSNGVPAAPTANKLLAKDIKETGTKCFM